MTMVNRYSQESSKVLCTCWENLKTSYCVCKKNCSTYPVAKELIATNFKTNNIDRVQTLESLRGYKIGLRDETRRLFFPSFILQCLMCYILIFLIWN